MLESMKGRPPTWLVLLTLWLMVFAVSSQFMIIAPILPRIAEQLQVPTARLSALVTGYAAALGTVALVMGPVSDRYGRRRMLLAGTAAMAVALGLHALAVDFTSLLIARVVAGAAGGVLTGAAVAYVGDYFPYGRRGWANGWVLSGVAMGQILGVPIGAMLAASFGFRSPFVAFAAATALACAMVWLFLPQPPAWTGTPTAARAGGALRQYASLLRHPPLAAAAGVYFTSNLSSSLYTLYLPVWLEAERGALPAQSALVFAFGGLATVVAGPRAGRLSDRVGRRRVVLFACAGGATLMLGTPWMITGPQTAYAVFFLLMALAASRASPLDALMTEVAPASQRGAMMSLLMAVGQLGFGLGGALAGAIYASSGYGSNAVLGAAALLGAAWLVLSFIPEPGVAPAVGALQPAASLPVKGR